MHLFQGIYIGCWCVSLGAFSYALIKYVQGEYINWLIFLWVIGILVVILIARSHYTRKIKNKYSDASTYILKGASGITGVSTLYTFDEFLVVMGIIIMLIGITSMELSICLLLKSYCYSIVDEENLEKVKRKRDSKKAKFNRYGKKNK